MKIYCKYDELLNPKELQNHLKNRNKHPQDQIERLAELYKYHGIRHPIIVSNLSKKVVAGHGRKLAAIRAGIKEFPVVYQDFDTKESEYAFMQSDNAISEWSELDLSGINSDLPDLGPDFDIDMLGIKDFTLDVSEKENEGLTDADSVPEEVPSKAKIGDLFILGNHRLLCGDSTDKESIEKLMNGQKADMVFTDPPYGMNAVSKSGVLKDKYKHDIMGDSDNNAAKNTFDLIYNLFIKASHFWWGANYYSSCLPDSECWIVWDKKNGMSDQTDAELAWSNCRSVVRRFEMASEKINRIHPTQKPVQLFLDIIKRLKLNPETVLDLFGGSGSTLIACEKTNRKCYMMELDPHYIDVIIKRWQNFTGKKAVHENGKLWDDLD